MYIVFTCCVPRAVRQCKVVVPTLGGSSAKARPPSVTSYLWMVVEKYLDFYYCLVDTQSEKVSALHTAYLTYNQHCHIRNPEESLVIICPRTVHCCIAVVISSLDSLARSTRRIRL